jgi:large subunit ribosomal protein L30
MLKITLKKSIIGVTERMRKHVTALGLTKTGKTVIRQDDAATRGNIHKVKHLLNVEKIDEKTV